MQPIRVRGIVWLVLVVPSVMVAAPVTSPKYPGVVCEDIFVPMRDGTLLATSKYSPQTPGKYPVIIIRDPYTRGFGGGCFSGIGGGALGPALPDFAQHGYVGLAQQVRGTNQSQGPFREMVQEAQDGYDAIEWAAAQPWSTGKIGTTSGSYLGLTQWQPAIHTPPHLAAICPQITASDYHDNWTYVNAVFDLWFGMSWPPGWVSDQLIRGLQAIGAPQAEIDQLVATWNTNVNDNLANKWVWQLPLTGFDKFTVFAPFFYDWIDHPTYDEFWARLDVETRWDQVKVPALITTAWYDIFQVGAFRNYQGMRHEGGTREARRGTKIIVGAYGHAGDSGFPTFGMDPLGFGSPTVFDAQLPFFDHYLKGIDNGYEDEPPVQLYVLMPPDTGNVGSGFMMPADSYPLPDTSWVRLFLASGGNANSSKGDGQLVDDEPRHQGTNPDRFDYDPTNPVPTTGGNMCCNNILLANGAQDQTQVEQRGDVLVYTSPPLEKDTPVVGPVEVRLWAQSSARDTDFTAKLVDVHLDGVTHNVLDRIVRARYRQGSKLPPSLITPGETYEYRIPLGNAGTIFKTGHRIRLEISSSSFPHYDRNLNTGDVNEWSAGTQVAHQTVLHDRKHPSNLLLPIVWNVAIPK
jgi:putative CocE/NonD family hydrolase